MSLTVSLALTALGGVFYKYDRSQKFMVDPKSSVGWAHVKEGLYKDEIGRINTRVINIATNFTQDFMKSSPWWYPIRGFEHFIQNRKTYLKSAMGFMGLYLFSFAFILILFWITISPIYLTFFIMLGPFGVWLATIHSFLQANVFTMMFVRLINPSNSLVFQCLTLKKYTKIKLVAPIRYYVPITTTYFWIYHLPMKIGKYAIISILFIIQLSLSFIPIIGPFLFQMSISPYIGKIYLTRILRLQHLNNLQRKERFYNHFGLFVSFGITAALLETIPFLSGVAVSTNYISTGLWLIDNY
ncbi:outer spore wall protein Lds1p [Monosporozyma servazzii]